jgi:polyisoprenoid-binding protein YceI
MKTNTKPLLKTFGLFLSMLIMSAGLQAQTIYQSNAGKVTVKGTSTLHDWEMVSAKGQTKATFTLNENELTGITQLSFMVAAESLKSDKSGLDKNAYKALNTDKHKNIAFTMTNGTVSSSGNNKYKISATGNLVINGVSKKVTLQAEGIFNPADQSIRVVGNTKFAMSSFSVKPPVLMMGTVKTGDDITIEFQVNLTK